MRLEPIVYSGLLIAALGGAYWASLPAQDADSTKTSIFNIDPKSVTELHYARPSAETSVVRNEAGKFWVSVQTSTQRPIEQPPVESFADEVQEPAAEPKAEMKKEQFLGSDRFQDLLKSLNPFEALRVIGKVDDSKLDEYGLKDQTEFFTAKGSDGKQLKLTLGKKSYGGSNRFALDDQGRVLLVDGRLFDDLDRAKLRLIERRLVDVSFEEASKLHVSANGVNKALVPFSEKLEELQWADDEENAQPKPVYKSWLDKIERLRLSTFASQDEEQTLGAIEPFLTLTLEKNGKPAAKLSFKKEGTDKITYWATSDFLTVHVSLPENQALAIEKDIATILANQ